MNSTPIPPQFFVPHTLRDARADYKVGKQLSVILRGAWRAAPPAPDFTAADLEFALPHLRVSHTAAMAWWKIRHSPLAQNRVGASLRAHYVSQAMQAAQGTYRVFQFVSALEKQGIEPIVFKGWALFPYYAEPALRSAGDVDLAVPRAEAKRAREIMEQIGAGPVDVDIHAELNDPAHAAFIPNSQWAELVDRSQVTPIGRVAVRVLDYADALQMVTIHCMRHLAARAIWVADIAALLEARPPDFDWKRCLSIPPFNSWIVFGILLAHKLLGANIQDTPFAERTNDLPEWLERDVLMRWADHGALDHKIYPSLLAVWREPSQWQAAIQARVPNRFAATLEYNGSLDEPFLARHQIRLLARKFGIFARRNGVSKS